MSDAQRDDQRLLELIDVVVAIASFQFDRRAQVGDGSDVLDGLAVGINMLAEEIGARVAREHSLQRRLAHNERLIAIGQLAAGIAHEINNPAAYALANLESVEQALARLGADLQRGDADVAALVAHADAARQWTREAHDGLERIVAIVRDLRRFTQDGADVIEAIDLRRVIQDACALVRSEIVFRATLDVQLPVPLVVRGDRTKLTQVFTNLLLNAAQAIPDDAATLHRVTVEAIRDGAGVAVLVRDTGAGIPDAVRRRLFEPFFTTKPRERGTGLGLVISADIVRVHGGELRLRETSPAGTTFEVRLPLLPEEALQTSVAAPTPTAAVPALDAARRPRVLLIDDEELILAAFQRFLGDAFDVHRALGGEAAIARCTTDQDWDVLVCDVTMPEVDGFAVHEWIATHAPALEPRMMFCTGGTFTPRGARLADIHADRLLHKPFSAEAFRQAVSRMARATR